MSYQRKLVRRTRKGRRQVVYQPIGDVGDGVMTGGLDFTAAPPSGSSSSDSGGLFGSMFGGGSGVMTGGLSTAGASLQPSSSSGSGSSSSAWGSIGQIGGSLLSSFFGPKPGAPVIAQQGMSPTTTIALVGAGVVALALIMRRKD